jgi:CRISPR-associated RAMP protein (TIGR02581 family)
LLDTFRSRLRLTGVLTTRTGLHVGAGGSGDPLATDAPVVRNAAGTPFLPGSSLKGVLRSAAEALMRGSEPRSGADFEWRTCEFLAGAACVGHQRVDDLRQEFKAQLAKEDLPEAEREARGNRLTAEAVWQESCTVCRLFGSLALASRVRFPDLPLEGEVLKLELRNGVGIDRDRELAAAGVLYDFEAVPPGTGFELTVLLDNASDAEVGLVLYLFEQLDHGYLALGGKTSRGLGQVGIRWDAIRETTLAKDNPFAGLLSSRDLLQADAPGDESEDAAPAEPELPASGDQAAWRTLAQIVREMPIVDKGELGQKAGERGLKKGDLNDRLGLGLEGKRAQQKVWDEVLARFVDCGLLVETASGHVLASAVPEEKGAAPNRETTRDPALQAVYDRFLSAIAREWQENH